MMGVSDRVGQALQRGELIVQYIDVWVRIYIINIYE